jgi:hypothetical protein
MSIKNNNNKIMVHMVRGNIYSDNIVSVDQICLPGVTRYKVNY